MTKLGFLVGLSLVLSGCTSFYSSSIVGHDSPTLPLPRENGKTGLSMGFDLKTSPTGSIFTSDSTQSVLGTAFVRQRLGEFGPGQLDLQATVSEYFAMTNLVQRPHLWSSESRQTSYSGFGTVVGLRPSVLFGDEGGRSEYAIHALYNQESGDYRAFRASLTPSGSGPRGVDLSPRGRTASLAFEVRREFVAGDGWLFPSGERPRFTVGADLGYVLFDWPSFREGNGVARFSFLYGLENYWASCSVHIMPPLNLGISLGVGTSTRF